MALGVAASLVRAAEQAPSPLRVPASTAYIAPNPDGLRVSQRQGIVDWKDPSQRVLWFGDFKSTGEIKASVEVKAHPGTTVRLRLSVDGQSREADVAVSAEGAPSVVDFGEFEIKTTGYQTFSLEMAGASKSPIDAVTTLILDGTPAASAHFNLEPRRNAASVHLVYPTPKDWKIDAFYCEVTAVEDPVATFYMACGWHRGYLGMQVNGPKERRIIFSVWDSGNETKDRTKVAANDRVQLLAKGDGVEASDFGNEGTGGHSHLIYPWKTGELQRFLLTAKPFDTNHTVYTGYYFHPDLHRWMTIASFKAPKDGGYLHGLYSFSENFGGSNGHLRRKAFYGNQWLRTADGQWHEQTVATFSHDPTGKSARLDRFMGVENGQFFLSQGGFIPGFAKYGERFERPAAGIPPNTPAPLFPDP
jgi:hypothetical protein